MISFDAQMRNIHDHLYANANIRVPEDLQGEVAKVIQALSWAAVVGGAPTLTPEQASAAIVGDRDIIRPIARDMRDLFAAYNKSMQRYPREEGSLRLDDASVVFIVAALHGVDMSDVSRDWLGDALEVFRSTAAKRLGGQFFTDQRVTRLAMDLMRFDPAKDDLVDICAGTGGFLIAGVRTAQEKGLVDAPTIIGVEIDPSLAHLANSTLKHLANFPKETVFNADSFREPSHWPLQLRKTVVADSHCCLASNPPFGQKITVKDVSVLERFALGHVWSRRKGVWSQTVRTSPKPPDILFLERNVQLAIPGEGRIAIVLPYQILSGPKLGYVREWLLRHTKILSVIDLPEDTFQPWTGTKTALLVAERRQVPLEVWEVEDYPVFCAVSRHIGHDRRGTPILDHDGRIFTDIDDISEAFDSYVRGEDPSLVSKSAFVISALRFSRENDLRINAAFHQPSGVEIRESLDNDAKESDFEIRTIGSVTKRIFYPGRFKRNYVQDPVEGVQFFGGTNITQLLPTNRKYLSKDDPKLDGFLVEEGWVLVTRSGSTGIVSSVPKAWSGLAMSEHVIRIVPDPETLPGVYIEAFLRSVMGQRLLSQGVFGSVIDEISPDHISNIPIPVPKDLETLKRICGLQEKANFHRQEAISMFDLTDCAFEELVGRKIVAVRDNTNIGLPSENVGDECEELVKS